MTVRGKKILKIFMISAITTLFACVLVAGIGITAYNTLIYQEDTRPIQEPVGIAQNNEEVIEEEIEEIESTLNKTVAVFGTDFSGGLTDAIMVVNFNSQEEKVNVISVPRDTQVTWTEEQIALLPDRHSWVRMGKINEMSAWGGLENVRGLTVDQLELILGISIDNYVLVSLDSFREIVDAVGGVEIDVPQRMYKAEVDGGLRIDLQPGLQTLNGTQAEQFVRYRDYTTGDLGRIEAQQMFIQAFTDQVMSPQIVMKIPEIVTTVFSSVKTDVTLAELPEYIPYLDQLSKSTIEFHTLPGIDRRENGISYYFADLDEVDVLVENLFYAQE